MYYLRLTCICKRIISHAKTLLFEILSEHYIVNSFLHSFVHSFIHLFINPSTYSTNHPPTDSLIQSQDPSDF